jgi:hypothetical protein
LREERDRWTPIKREIIFRIPTFIIYDCGKLIYEVIDGSNKININSNSFTYDRTFPGYQGNFTFEFDANSDWKITNHPLKFGCYMVTVNRNMSKFEVSPENSPNNNINKDVVTLTWIVQMKYENGKQTNIVIAMYLPTNDPLVENRYLKT